jgi:hypothetical protein
MKYLELAHETIIEIEIGEANIDLTKIFKKNSVKQIFSQGSKEMGFAKPQWKSGILQTLKLTDIRQYINDLEVESITYACPNILHLDLSGSGKIKNQMICKIVSHLSDLHTFVGKRLPLLSNLVLH